MGHSWGAGSVLLLDLRAGFVGVCFTGIHLSVCYLFLIYFFMFVLHFTIKVFFRMELYRTRGSIRATQGGRRHILDEKLVPSKFFLFQATFSIS